MGGGGGREGRTKEIGRTVRISNYGCTRELSFKSTREAYGLLECSSNSQVHPKLEV